MKNKNFIINEKELAVFLRFNSIYGKMIAPSNMEGQSFVELKNKSQFIENYIKKISSENLIIAKNRTAVNLKQNDIFWALNRNFEEIYYRNTVNKEKSDFTELLD